MISDLNKYVDFLVEEDITPSQFLLLYCLYLDENPHLKKRFNRNASNGHPVANIYKYIEAGKGWTTEEMDDLIDRGFMVNRGKSSKYRAADMHLTRKFIQRVMATEDSFDEMFEEYPGYVRKEGGGLIPLKSVDEIEVRKLYLDRVRSVAEHERVMTAIRWANERSKKGEHFMTMRIDRFITARLWRDIEKIMLEQKADAETVGDTHSIGKSNKEEDYDF